MSVKASDLPNRPETIPPDAQVHALDPDQARCKWCLNTARVSVTTYPDDEGHISITRPWCAECFNAACSQGEEVGTGVDPSPPDPDATPRGRGDMMRRFWTDKVVTEDGARMPAEGVYAHYTRYADALDGEPAPLASFIGWVKANTFTKIDGLSDQSDAAEGAVWFEGVRVV